MYKNVLQNIDNIEIWPVLSLIIFFVFFLGILIYVLKVDKNYIKMMKELPMNDGTDEKSTSQNQLDNK